MTPEDLRALAGVMRELGVFKLALPDGVTIELSQLSIQAGQAELLAKQAPPEVKTEPAPPPTPEEEDDALTYAATEG